MFSPKTRNVLQRKVPWKERAIWWSKAVGFWIAVFVTVYLIDWYLIYPEYAPFKFAPANYCQAFVDLPYEGEFPECSPCNPAACPSPCPRGFCPSGYVAPCPALSSSPPPLYGWGNWSTPGGPVCPSAVCSPAGCDRMCPVVAYPSFPAAATIDDEEEEDGSSSITHQHTSSHSSPFAALSRAVSAFLPFKQRQQQQRSTTATAATGGSNDPLFHRYPLIRFRMLSTLLPNASVVNSEDESSSSHSGGSSSAASPSISAFPTPPPGAKLLSPAEFCREICPLEQCGRGLPTKAEQTVLDAIHIFEIVYFAIGVTFAVYVGPGAFKVHTPKLRKAVIKIYLILCFHMLSWYPHLTLHLIYPDISPMIILDLVFHIPIAVTALALIVYVYRMLRMASTWRPREKTGQRCVDFFRDPKVQAILFAFFIAAVNFSIGTPQSGIVWYQLRPYWESWQRSVWMGIDIFQALEMGAAFGLVYVAVPILRHIDDKRVLYQAVPLVFSLWYIIGNWYWHSILHIILPQPW